MKKSYTTASINPKSSTIYLSITPQPKSVTYKGKKAKKLKDGRFIIKGDNI